MTAEPLLASGADSRNVAHLTALPPGCAFELR